MQLKNSIALPLVAAAFVLPGGCASGPPGPMVAPPPDQEVVLIDRVVPIYPILALSRCTTGYSEVRFTIDEMGRVHHPIVIASRPSDVFDAAALSAVAQWRFSPRIVDGIAVKRVAQQVIEFRAPENCVPFETDAPAESAAAFSEHDAREACLGGGGTDWGYSELQFDVGADGVATDVVVARSTSDHLNDLARASLAQERFEPQFVGKRLSRILEFCTDGG